jgi:hypothetical protein
VSEPDGAPAVAPADEDELTRTVLLIVAKRYGMRTDMTDWNAVIPAATRARRGAAILQESAAATPLRVVPPAPR